MTGARQQRELDRFRHDYNEVRPHEALGIADPGGGLRAFAAALSGAGARGPIPAGDAGTDGKAHKHFRWKKHDVFVSEVLWGEPIGLLVR